MGYLVSSTVETWNITYCTITGGSDSSPRSWDGSMFKVGSELLLRIVFKRILGGVSTLVDPSTITLTISRPLGANVTPTVTRESLGTYVANFTPSASGTHKYKWVSSGGVVSVEDGAFFVERTLI